MKSRSSDRKFLVGLVALVAALFPLLMTGCGGGAFTSLDAASQQSGPPTITSIVPNSASPSGGMIVVINGANFTSGTQQTSPSVSFGGAAATDIKILSSQQLRAKVPPHSKGKVTVQVTTGGGMSTSAPNGFTYTSSSPIISSVSPGSGSTDGGTVVTIAGSNFESGATVSFGGSPASNVSFVSSAQLQASTPAHAAGSVDVAVTNPDGTNGVLTGGFTFTSGSLTVSSVSPNSGGTAGGTVVTVNGSNFASGATVTFGSVTAASVSFVSSTQLKATTPPHASGAVSVTVTDPGGASAVLTGGFTFGTSTFSVNSVSPVSGPADGGTKVTISGSGFQTGVSVSFGGLGATSVSLTNSSSIEAVTPAHNSGSVTVTVTNSSGSSATLASGFAFHSIGLDWNAPSSSPVTVTGYNIYRGNAAAGPFSRLNGSTPVTATSYDDTTVDGSTTYYYEVKSVDSNGVESPPDGPVPATTSP
ncbi:MAG TPA: IPT/TIG domain-containing protein [Terriglobia bacterium]|nr:IPT/TIG domain-containing protein [Terriglobia bacterium]